MAFWKRTVEWHAVSAGMPFKLSSALLHPDCYASWPASRSPSDRYRSIPQDPLESTLESRHEA